MSIHIWRKYLGSQQAVLLVAVTCGRKTCKAVDGSVASTDSDRSLGGVEAPDMVDATAQLRRRGWDVDPGWIRCPEHRRRAAGQAPTRLIKEMNDDA